MWHVHVHVALPLPKASEPGLVNYLQSRLQPPVYMLTELTVLHVLHAHGHKHHNHLQRSSGACTYAEAREGREGRPALERRGGLLVLLVTAGLLRALRVAVLGVDCLLG